MLTPKQDTFVKAIVFEGMNYSDAYKAAYDTKGMSAKTINEKASRLKDEDKIRARIAELRAEIDSPKIMSEIKRAEKLSEFAESGDPDTAMKAIDLLNKMQGIYVKKVEANVNVAKLEDLL